MATKSSIKKKKGRILFLYALPFFIYIFVFQYLPLAGWVFAFFDYKPGIPLRDSQFVGLKYFREIIGNEYIQKNIGRVLKNTLGMAGISYIFVWLPMFFAILLNEMHNQKYKRVVQTLTTIPNFISWVLVFAFAFAMFSVSDGLVNNLLIKIGVLEEGYNFLAMRDHPWLTMWMFGTWKSLGWSAIIYLATISGIDQELYEAARVDGAGRIRLAWHITLPHLLPTFFVMLILGMGNLLSTGLEQYLLFQNPLSQPKIETLDLYVYNQGLGRGNYSYATVVGMLKSVVSVILVTVTNWLSKVLRGSSIF